MLIFTIAVSFKVDSITFNMASISKFVENDYILCPPVFTNIYKGALGEYVGREILRSYGIELEEITEFAFVGKTVVRHTYFRLSVKADCVLGINS